MSQNFHYILDAGHGGVINEQYTTSTDWWKRSYFKDGVLMASRLGVPYLEKNCTEKFYEGVSNREIRDELSKMLISVGLEHSYVCDSQDDCTLSQRVYHANLIAGDKGARNCLFISIHSNAGRGRGIEVYTSKGITAADPFGQILCEELAEEFKTSPFRKDLKDGDWDKEADFYVLKHTVMPAVLSENFFYDNYEDFKLLSNPKIKTRIAKAHFNAILRFETEL